MLPLWWQPYVQEFIARVQYLANFANFTVSSFGRTRAHNASVGGVERSQHLLWTAADLVPDDYDMESLKSLADATGAFGFTLNEGDHVHVQLFAASELAPYPWLYDQVPLAA